MVVSAIFENIITKERLICDNIHAVKWLDGVAFLSVRRENQPRTFLIRRDSLKKIV